MFQKHLEAQFKMFEFQQLSLYDYNCFQLINEIMRSKDTKLLILKIQSKNFRKYIVFDGDMKIV